MNKGLTAIILSVICILGIIYVIDSNPKTQPAFDTTNELELIIYKEDKISKYTKKNEIQIVNSNDEDIIYVSTEKLENEFNIYSDYDIENNILIITTKDKVYRFYGEENKVKINQEETENIPPMIVQNNTPLIPLKYIEEDLNLNSEYHEDENNVFLKSIETNEIVASISRDNIKLRSDKSLLSNVIGTLQTSDEIKVLEKDNQWIKVMTLTGQDGYVASNAIENEEVIEGIEIVESEPIWKPRDEKIVLTWEPVYSRNPNTSKIGALKSVNIVSPTWIHLANSSGKLGNNIDRDYVEWAHNRDYKVWALFSNSFDPKLTDEFLKDSVVRERTINDLLELIQDNNIDGVNIDFENVYLKNKGQLVQFIRELVPIFHENDLVVSMDVTVRGGSETWSQFLDRKELGKVVDYIAVMTYDEHWASSPKSGSVASLGWVERGIQGLLEEVPNEKLLLGLPFYTRLWIETPSETEVDKMSVKSKAISMETVNEIMAKNNVIKLWDDVSGQHYLVYMEDNKLHKIWVEDAQSIALKVDLVNKYDLAGVAAWRRGFETEDIWEAISNTLYESEEQ